MRVYITADTHGIADEFRKLRDFALDKDLCEEDIIIIAGDAGLYYGGHSYGSGRKILSQTPCRFLILRGNHDDRICDVIREFPNEDVWAHQSVLGNDVFYDKRYPTILYALDGGGLYDIYGEKVLFVPGAYSIDKQYRLDHGFPYNPHEQLTTSEMDALLGIAEENPDIVGVIAHTAPLSWEPHYQDLFFSSVDQSKVDKTTDRFLDALIERLPQLKYYYFGHFHDDRSCGERGRMLYRDIVEYGMR